MLPAVQAAQEATIIYPRAFASSRVPSFAGRGSGGMFSSAPSRSAHAPSAPAKSHAPAPAHVAPAAPPAFPPAAPSGGMLSGIGSTIVQGMAFGTGSAIAHRAVGAAAGMFGGSDEPQPAQTPAAPAPAQVAAGRAADCSPFQRDFVRCLQEVRVRSMHCIAVCVPLNGVLCRTSRTSHLARCSWTISTSAKRTPSSCRNFKCDRSFSFLC